MKNRYSTSNRPFSSQQLVLLGAEGEAWDDDQIADALDTSWSTIHRVRQAFVEKGLGGNRVPEEADGPAIS